MVAVVTDQLLTIRGQLLQSLWRGFLGWVPGLWASAVPGHSVRTAWARCACVFTPLMLPGVSPVCCILLHYSPRPPLSGFQSRTCLTREEASRSALLAELGWRSSGSQVASFTSCTGHLPKKKQNEVSLGWNGRLLGPLSGAPQTPPLQPAGPGVFFMVVAKMQKSGQAPHAGLFQASACTSVNMPLAEASHVVGPPPRVGWEGLRGPGGRVGSGEVMHCVAAGSARGCTALPPLGRVT